MTLAELIARCRTDSDDVLQPPLAPDDVWTGWLNDATKEAAIRARLLFEADNDDLCVISVDAEISGYPLPAGWFLITRATFTPDGTEDERCLHLTTRPDLDARRPGWRRMKDCPSEVIVDDTRITLGCLPSIAGTLRLEGYRLPLTPMAKDGDTPEIGAIHHDYLSDWALGRYFGQPDSEIYNPGRATAAVAAFERQFGPRPDAQMARDFQADRPQHNQAVW